MAGDKVAFLRGPEGFDDPRAREIFELKLRINECTGSLNRALNVENGAHDPDLEGNSIHWNTELIKAQKRLAELQPDRTSEVNG